MAIYTPNNVFARPARSCLAFLVYSPDYHDVELPLTARSPFSFSQLQQHVTFDPGWLPTEKRPWSFYSQLQFNPNTPNNGKISQFY